MTTQTLNMTQYFIDNPEVTIATKLILMLYQFNGLKNGKCLILMSCITGTAVTVMLFMWTFSVTAEVTISPVVFIFISDVKLAKLRFW